MTPLFIYQEVIPFDVAGQILGYFCKENFPNSFWNYSFTLMILLVQYLMPLMLLPIVHAKILIFLRKNSGFQNDSRRKEREIKRNKRMTKILSSISLIFAISWLPYHIYLILTDIFTLFQEKVSFSSFQFQSSNEMVTGPTRDLLFGSGYMPLRCHDFHLYQPSTLWMVQYQFEVRIGNFVAPKVKAVVA